MNWYKIGQNISEQLNAILEKWRSQGVTLFVYEDNNAIDVDSIIVPKDRRKQGIGTQIMNEIVGYADQSGKRVELTPGQRDDYNATTSRKRLVNFYKRFGLIENKGRNKDYTTMKGMYRSPKK